MRAILDGVDDTDKALLSYATKEAICSAVLFHVRNEK